MMWREDELDFINSHKELIEKAEPGDFLHTLFDCWTKSEISDIMRIKALVAYFRGWTLLIVLRNKDSWYELVIEDEEMFSSVILGNEIPGYIVTIKEIFNGIKKILIDEKNIPEKIVKEMLSRVKFKDLD